MIYLGQNTIKIILVLVLAFFAYFAYYFIVEMKEIEANYEQMMLEAMDL